MTFAPFVFARASVALLAFARADSQSNRRDKVMWWELLRWVWSHKSRMRTSSLRPLRLWSLGESGTTIKATNMSSDTKRRPFGILLLQGRVLTGQSLGIWWQTDLTFRCSDRKWFILRGKDSIGVVLNLPKKYFETNGSDSREDRCSENRCRRLRTNILFNE